MAEYNVGDLNAGLLLEFLESSDSSSDEELLSVILKDRKVKPKVHDFLTVVHEYSEEDFKGNFRLDRTTCYKLVEDFHNSDHYPSNNEHGGKETITAERHILSFLWFAGNKSCFRTVANRFGICEASFHRIMHRVMTFLLAICPTVIKFPNSEEDKVKLAADFEEISGFPNVLGCIDGSYIPIRTPANKIKSTYVNRHDGTSITLQGICDNRRRFLDVFTGTSSKIHDARILKLSFIYDDLPNICGERWHILGDAAYPLRKWLLTPFRDYGNLTQAQKNFNYTLSGTRVLVENAFGMLKNRFRQLMRLDFHSLDTTSKFVVACCVLHNLCIDNEDLWEDLDNETIAEIPLNQLEGENLQENVLRHLGEMKRNEICQELRRN